MLRPCVAISPCPLGDSQALATIPSELGDDDGALVGRQANVRPVFTIHQHVEQVLEFYASLAIEAD